LGVNRSAKVGSLRWPAGAVASISTLEWRIR
jgi:hypothetical protein